MYKKIDKSLIGYKDLVTYEICLNKGDRESIKQDLQKELQQLDRFEDIEDVEIEFDGFKLTFFIEMNYVYVYASPNSVEIEFGEEQEVCRFTIDEFR